MELKTILMVCFLLLAAMVYSQQRQLQGVLKTSDGKAVANASVTVKNKQRILAFKPSDSDGAFTLAWPDTVDISDLHLEINHLGYKKVSLPLSDKQTRYDILMEEQAIDLAEVAVRSRPRIDARGDTLSYDVASFAKPEDRTIGDVLRRMPGMEVGEDGQIKYNGKAISNFYIDGDDLLDDKYAIGTKTIPHAMVKDIDVMQNHQPLKVLENKTLSENVALNLKIKDEAKLKLTGQAKPGGGLPGQYDGELNTMLFNKKYKMLNVGKANNVGTNLNTDFTAFNRAGMLSSMGNSRPAELLSSGTVGNPALPTNRYYLNNSGSLNANNLMNLDNGWQLKSNIGLLLDQNEMDYYSANDLYLANDTISYNENQQINKQPFLTELSLNLQANKEKYYFNNALKIGYSGETGKATLTSNEMDMGQELHSRVRDFSNNLEYVPELANKNILSINWYLNHFNRPQTLNIYPGINEDVLNGGEAFATLQQFTETPTWFNTLSLGYRLPSGTIKQHYRLSTLNEWQQLNSQLRLSQLDGEVNAYTESNDNNLHWQRHHAQFNATYEYKHGKWESLLSLPVTWQRIAYEDEGFALDENKERMLFNPFFRAKYLTNAEDYLSFNYVYSNQMGNINGVYRGAILSNYRNLRANDAQLEERSAHNAGLGYNFQRNISMLFMNVGAHYTLATANTIASNIITDNISQTVLLPYDNDVSTFSANAGISKYIFALGATTGIKASWSTTRYNQFLNGELLPYNNVSFSLTPNFEARLWNRISLNYEGTGTWTTSKLVHGETATSMPDIQIRRYDQSVSLMCSPFRNTFLRLSGRHQYTSQQQLQDISYFFADANIRYKLDKWNTDLELDFTNLANITEYETYSLTANQFGYSRYNLRGRMAVLKLAFNL
ncbi:carboxypeptidase-like regulatory domain-containing protein [Parapedobacter tibetensis]|uniref:carboxypeptidase-like regulatory domain-containing protein n=1 Tax=Parapedobacter tibetensis TaxID=2972951 RepID=UPI00214D8E9D|nr:carboxypeptidase-like regulatory domain-containing protein [Parapedobacter tibetensis]